MLTAAIDAKLERQVRTEVSEALTRLNRTIKDAQRACLVDLGLTCFAEIHSTPYGRWCARGSEPITITATEKVVSFLKRSDSPGPTVHQFTTCDAKDLLLEQIVKLRAAKMAEVLLALAQEETNK